MRYKEFSENAPLIKLSGNWSSGRAEAQEWIDKVYDLYPGTWQNNHVMSWGKGDNQQFAAFELVPSFSKPGAVEVKWFQAYPLRSGVGTRAMAELQRLAKEDDISLTLFPWDKGQVSQSALTKFYKKQGFKPTTKGSKNMHWEPAIDENDLYENASVGATCSGSIATTSQPIGGILRRAQDSSLLGGTVTNEEYPNTPDWIIEFKRKNKRGKTND